MHEAKCCGCLDVVKWQGGSDGTVTLLSDRGLITGVLVWNKEDNDWRVVCRKCLRDWAFNKVDA